MNNLEKNLVDLVKHKVGNFRFLVNNISGSEETARFDVSTSFIAASTLVEVAHIRDFGLSREAVAEILLYEKEVIALSSAFNKLCEATNNLIGNGNVTA